ncbi:hypothetical protein JHK82_025097 [Glycine max]|nr:hypothetical protein JHK82_025097 [Glycine max]
MIEGKSVKRRKESLFLGFSLLSHFSSKIKLRIRKYEVNSQPKEAFLPEESKDPEMKLLDLYCGCRAMSTGLCLGGNLSGMNLVTRWVVDLNKHACECLKLNHPDTEISISMGDKNLRPWLIALHVKNEEDDDTSSNEEVNSEDDNELNEDDEIFEVSEILVVCYGDPNKKKEQGLYFKGYGSALNSCEPIEFWHKSRLQVTDIAFASYNEGQKVQLQKKLLLEDAISNLPMVQNNECRDEIKYDKVAQTEFQRFIRLSKHGGGGSFLSRASEGPRENIMVGIHQLHFVYHAFDTCTFKRKPSKKRVVNLKQHMRSMEILFLPLMYLQMQKLWR